MQKLNSNQQELVSEHLEYAKRVAYRFYQKRRNMDIELDDLIGAAYLGLCDAAVRFKSSKEVEFKTYSYLRIRGAMYDLLRRNGISRSTFNELIANQENLNTEESKQSERSVDENKLPYSIAYSRAQLERLSQIIEQAGIRLYVSPTKNYTDIGYAEDLCPERQAELLSLNRYIQDVLNRLPKAPRKLIEMRYYEDCSYREMSDVFNGASKSWISRMHTRALGDLETLIIADSENCKMRRDAYAYVS